MVDIKKFVIVGNFLRKKLSTTSCLSATSKLNHLFGLPLEFTQMN